MEISEQEKAARQVIDQIRKGGFLLDIGSVPDTFKEGALNLQTQLNNALKLLSDELYSTKSHFVLELIQNADDNLYAPGITPHLLFEVLPSRLVVVNNEIGFTEEHVKAICSVGASSKSKQKSGYIGEKGIGFKSVFTVSDAPEIHSNGFHFKFDRTVDENPLGYVIPHWCEPPADVQPGCTTIILPAAKNYEFGANTLVDLDARLLLFLNKLRQLTLLHNGQRATYRREDQGELSILSAMHASEGAIPSSEEMRYVRAEVTFPMKEPFVDERRPGIEQTKVVLAFPVDASGTAKPDPESYVFAFLPIRQLGFKFAIQADFILNASREEILSDRPWNQFLREGVAAVFLRAVETFKTTESLALSYLKYVPADREIVAPFFRPLRKLILEKLASSNCLLSASGSWSNPTDLRIAENGFRALLPSHIAKQLFGFDYVDSRTEGGHDLLRNLGVREAGSAEILALFDKHAVWLQEQSLEWRARFYAYLADNQTTLIRAGLLKRRCLPISNGAYVVPSESNVFFPLGKGKKYGFESELVLVDYELYKEAQDYSDQVVQLFAAMKVRVDEPYELVNAHILPMHRGEAWTTSDFKALVGHLRYVKDKLKEYLASASEHGKSETQAYQLLRDGIWIGTKKQVDGTWTFGRVGQLYLSKEYKANFCIESLLGEALDTEKLVSPDYLARRPKDPDANAESWRQFFTRLGVRLAPAIVQNGNDWKCSDELRLLLDSPKSTVRRKTLECISKHWGTYAGHLTYVLGITRPIHKPKDTQFLISLRGMQAPTKKRVTVPLADAYYPTPELRTLLGDSLPYIEAELTDEMLDACGVTRRLDAQALVKRLMQLKTETSGSTKQVHGIYRALDERLWGSAGAFIKQAFEEESLIQIKGVHEGWFKPSEVAWLPSSTFLDSLYPPLRSLYRDFSRFFIDRLGVPRELPTTKWVEALTRLGTIADPAERKAEALAIFRRANRDLAPKFGREVLVPDWIETFQTEPVFVDHRGGMVSNDGSLFANDIPAVAALFEDDEDLSFLAVPYSEVPRLGRLLDAAELPRLSNAITEEVSNASSGVVNDDLTRRVRSSVVFFARVLYAKRQEAFEEALEEDRFTGLRNFEVAEVPQVGLTVSLGDFSRETTAEIARSGNRVLYRSGTRSVKDMLAAELSKFLGTYTDLADTFARILLEDEPENIEDFLRVRNIGPLPADLLEAVDRCDRLMFEEDEKDVPDDAFVEQPGEVYETISEIEDFAASDEEADQGADGHELSAGSKSLPTPPAPFPEGADVCGTASGVQRAPSTKQGNGPAGDSNPTSGPSRAEPATSLGRSRAKAPEQNIRIASDESGSPVDPSRAGANCQSERSPERHSGAGGSYQTKEPLAGKAKRARHQPHRTKSGRLLSYVAGPGESDRPNPNDDPAKAAVRNATERAAVDYFMTTQAGRWQSMTEMPHNNPGFDVQAIADDGEEEFIEIKGQGGAWTEEGVALTPRELMTAQQKSERYWLCVVEYAQDEKRRQLHLLRNPYGLIQQFRFDVGWKSAFESAASVPLKPEKEMYIDMQDVGCGRIISVRGKGRFFNLHVMLEDGRQVNKPFNPAKMTLSKEPTWQE